MPRAHDITVIGGGVMGCSALYSLARLGVRNTLLLERGTLASGMTGRSMAIVRMHYSNEVTVRMAWASRGVIASFSDITGNPGGFVQTGYLFIAGQGQEQALARNVALCQRIGVPCEVLSPAAAAARWPDISFTGAAAVAHEPLSGYADSSAVTAGFAAAARSSGASVRLGVEVTGITTTRGAAVAVETPDGDVPTGAVIIAAGCWTPALLASLGAPLPTSFVRHQVVKLHRPLDRLPSHPTIADLPNLGLSVRPDSGDISLVALREDPAALETWRRGVDGDVAADAVARASARIPAMAEAGWDGGWSGLFDVTPDWHPVIDRVPGYDNVFVAAGFSGHGFKLSPSVGLALAELVTQGKSTTVDIRPLRFTRFAEEDLVRSAYGGTVFA
jgi:glycine/D-amino acid oxidase-like deaminating enzyme